MDEFITKIQKQLEKMTEQEKDDWLLSQVKIASERKREDLYKSLCGRKKVMYMPEKQEIDEFCEKVKNGSIVVEYETHYVEFDDMGNFHDDWEYEYYDPAGAMSFLETLFQGCHDLVVLEEFSLACEILDEILGLEFMIEDDPDTDDTCEEEVLDLSGAVREGKLSGDWQMVLKDYLKACMMSEKDRGEAARKMAAALEMQLFKKCKLHEDIFLEQMKPFAADIKKILEKDLKREEESYSKKKKPDGYYYEQYQDEEKIRRIKERITDLSPG